MEYFIKQKYLNILPIKSKFFLNDIVLFYIYISAKSFDKIYAPIKYFLGFDLTDNKIDDDRNFLFHFIHRILNNRYLTKIIE